MDGKQSSAFKDRLEWCIAVDVGQLTVGKTAEGNDISFV